MDKAKGGMCANPFGGRGRLDKLDISALAGGADHGLEVLARTVITGAVTEYLFFGLGRNGMVAQEFIHAYDYLFAVRADQPETWSHARELVVQDDRKGGNQRRRAQKVLTLSDDELRGLTFCHWYELAGLHRAMPIAKFRRLLMAERRSIVTDNLGQIEMYLRSLRDLAATRGEYSTCAPGDLVDTLTLPDDLGALSGLVYAAKSKPQADPIREHRSPFTLPRRIRGRREWIRYTYRLPVPARATAS